MSDLDAGVLAQKLGIGPERVEKALSEMGVPYSAPPAASSAKPKARPARWASDGGCANRISSMTSAVWRSADAARRSSRFSSVQYAVDMASTSSSTVPNVG